jgi:TPR repeat protein
MTWKDQRARSTPQPRSGDVGLTSGADGPCQPIDRAGCGAGRVPSFDKSREADVPAAWYHVGRAYLSGCGVPASPSTALRWLVRAADVDEVEA